MIKKSSDVMFAKLEGFNIDIEKLRQNFEVMAKKYEPIEYKDNQVDYVGWAVTSRDGSLYDGVRRIALKSNDPLDRVRGKEYTELCDGYLKEVMDMLKSRGIDPYRARMMQLASEGEEMAFHTDAKSESWRLHIPVITNEDSRFEWEREDGTIESVNLPADGSAWLVRVDIKHRAVNRADNKMNRVHLLMGCNVNPDLTMLTAPMIEC